MSLNPVKHTPDKTHLSPSHNDASSGGKTTPSVLRCSATINGMPPITVPLRARVSETTIDELCTSVLKRLSVKPALAWITTVRPSAIVLDVGKGIQPFLLDPDVNADDTLDCYIEDGVPDIHLSFTLCAPATGETLPPIAHCTRRPALSPTVKHYASQTRRAPLSARRVDEMLFASASPPPQRTPARLAPFIDGGDASTNGGAVAGNADGLRSATSRGSAAQEPMVTAPVVPLRVHEPRPPSKSRSSSPLDIQPTEPPAPEQALAPPRPLRMYVSAKRRSNGPSDAAGYKMQLFLHDCLEDELTLRQQLMSEQSTQWDALLDLIAMSAEQATRAALDRVSFAEQIRRGSIVASYDDFFAGEIRRFNVIASCIEEEAVRYRSPRSGIQAAAMDSSLRDLPLRANKCIFLSNLELVSRQEIETAAVEARNALEEDYLLYFTREAIRHDEQYITRVRLLKDEESESRAQITEVAFRKLGMFHRQCATGVARLRTVT